MSLPVSLESTELVCWKVAGGNDRVQRAVTIPGLRGVLYSFPLHSDRGGDIHYLSACGSGAVARMCIADVTGHGQEVAEFSGWLEESFSAHIHRASPAGVLRAVNKRAASRGLELMSTGICFSYNSLNGKLKFCSAGHPHMRMRRTNGCEWEPLTLPKRGGQWDLPMGVAENTRYGVGETKLCPGDQLLLYTDGLVEAHNAAGAQFGTTMFENECLTVPDIPPEDRGNALLKAWATHTGGFDHAEDDLTFAILECQPYQKGNRYALFIQNNFVKKA
jgi:sigma-B regulation protein RsbU (phosphoserine phosphatase)